MKKWFFPVLLSTQLAAQTSNQLSLADAYDLAQKNYPAIRQRDLVRRTEYLTIANLQKGYLPQLAVGGQATYQSEVTGLDISFPGITIQSPAKDQYKLTADLSQSVFDGGVIRQQKKAAMLNADLGQQKVEVELYQVKERVNQLYLGILFLDGQIQQAGLVRKDVEVGIKQVEAQVNNGVALRSNLNVLKAQLLQTDQHVIELTASKRGLVDALALFLNRTLNDATIFQRPVITFQSDSVISRPELKVYENQSQLLVQQNRLLVAKNLPKASLFAQGGYGRPGLNLLKNQFAWFYIAGVRFNWPLGGLYTLRKEKQLTEVNKEIVQVEKEIFMLNTGTMLRQQRAEISKYEELVQTDQAIIDLRLEVKQASLAQLENGVITANDYVREVNAEDQARQSLIAHGIQLLQAKINYQTTLGKQ